MNKCSICGGEIQIGTHHESTTVCIGILRQRIDALERLVAPAPARPPFPTDIPS